MKILNWSRPVLSSGTFYSNRNVQSLWCWVGEPQLHWFLRARAVATANEEVSFSLFHFNVSSHMWLTFAILAQISVLDHNLQVQCSNMFYFAFTWFYSLPIFTPAWVALPMWQHFVDTITIVLLHQELITQLLPASSAATLRPLAETEVDPLHGFYCLIC